MIGTDWIQLASILGFNQDIDVIDYENDQVFRKALKVLTKWKVKDNKEATVKRLIQVLKQLQRQDIVTNITKSSHASTSN